MDYVHAIWGLSKDFCMSGNRCGVLYSTNAKLVRAMEELGVSNGVGNFFQVRVCTPNLHTFLQEESRHTSPLPLNGVKLTAARTTAISPATIVSRARECAIEAHTRDGLRGRRVDCEIHRGQSREPPSKPRRDRLRPGCSRNTFRAPGRRPFRVDGPPRDC